MSDLHDIEIEYKKPTDVSVRMDGDDLVLCKLDLHMEPDQLPKITMQPLSDKLAFKGKAVVDVYLGNLNSGTLRIIHESLKDMFEPGWRNRQ